MNRTITISLPDDVAHDLEVRAAIDDLKLDEGVGQLLNELVKRWRLTR